MRKIRLAVRRWHRSLRRRGRRRRIAAIKETRIVAPSVLSFTKNYSASVTFLRELKAAALIDVPGQTRPYVFMDLSEVEFITPAAALVLAAEMDRWSRFRRAKLRPRNVADWDPVVRQTLAAMGFFRLLGVETGEPRSDPPPSKQITVLPMVSSTVLDGGLLQPMLDLLEGAASILGQNPQIYPALTEAAYNATLHAYPDWHEFEFPVPIKCWWGTACWNVEDGVVKFIVYDQGVGISATLPRSRHWERARSLLPEGFRHYTGDSSRMILAALEFDRTSLSGGHGKGLQDVVTPIKETRGAKVRILSGTGSIIYHYGGRVERSDERLHLGGTLVEWTIPVNSYQPG